MALKVRGIAVLSGDKINMKNKLKNTTTQVLTETKPWEVKGGRKRHPDLFRLEVPRSGRPNYH